MRFFLFLDLFYTFFLYFSEERDVRIKAIEFLTLPLIVVKLFFSEESAGLKIYFIYLHLLRM